MGLWDEISKSVTNIPGAGNVRKVFENPGADISETTHVITDPFHGQSSEFLGSYLGENNDLKYALDPFGKWKQDLTKKPAPPNYAAPDPALEKYRKEQVALATDMRNPYGDFQTNSNEKLRNDQLRELASTNKASSMRMASRGLYGKGAEGLQAKNVATAGANIGVGRATVRSAAEEQAKQIENDALNNAMKQRQTTQTMYDSVFNQAMTEYAKRRQALKTVGQVAGTVVGAYYGGPFGAAAGGAAGGELMG